MAIHEYIASEKVDAPKLLCQNGGLLTRFSIEIICELIKLQAMIFCFSKSY
jgi:hypothetical protein